MTATLEDKPIDQCNNLNCRDTPRLRSNKRAPKLLTSRSSDRLDVVHATAIPTAARSLRHLGARSKVFKQTRHRAGSAVLGDQLVATEGGLPFALAAGDEDHFARLVGQPVERALDRHRAAAPFRVRARGSASTSAHHSSVVGSCGCDQERLSTASRACTMAITSLATSGRVASSRTKFGKPYTSFVNIVSGRSWSDGHVRCRAGAEDALRAGRAYAGYHASRGVSSSKSSATALSLAAQSSSSSAETTSMCSMMNTLLFLIFLLRTRLTLKLSVLEDVEPPLAMDQVVSFVPHGFVFVCRMRSLASCCLSSLFLFLKSLRNFLGGLSYQHW